MLDDYFFYTSKVTRVDSETPPLWYFISHRWKKLYYYIKKENYSTTHQFPPKMYCARFLWRNVHVCLRVVVCRFVCNSPRKQSNKITALHVAPVHPHQSNHSQPALQR